MGVIKVGVHVVALSVQSEDVLLQQGVYTRTQAAYLAKLRPQTLSAWFDATGTRGPAIRRMMPENADELISFVDLIQLFAVRAVRRQPTPVSMPKIRDVVSYAEQLGVSFPFAREIRVFLFGKDIVLKLPNEDMIGASGRIKNNYLMEPVLLPYLRDITFGADGLANEYRPLPGILMTPKKEWGAPMVEGSGYTVQTIVSAAQSEGSIEAAADMCGVTVEQVQQALRYEDYLGTIA